MYSCSNLKLNNNYKETVKFTIHKIKKILDYNVKYRFLWISQVGNISAWNRNKQCTVKSLYTLCFVLKKFFKDRRLNKIKHTLEWAKETILILNWWFIIFVIQDSGGSREIFGLNICFLKEEEYMLLILRMTLQSEQYLPDHHSNSWKR